MIKTVESIFLNMGYIPYNNALSVVVEAEGFDSVKMRASLDAMHTRSAPRLSKATAAELEVYEWNKSATRHLLDECARLAADGCAPVYSMKKDDLTAVSDFICGLSCPAFRGMAAPEVMTRWTTANTGAPCLDIVPKDPRLGWDDIPDWQDL